MMEAMTQLSPMAGANQAHLEGDAASAMSSYVKALQQMPELGSVLWGNIARVRQQYLQNTATAQRPKAVVCGWALAHNAHGGDHALAAKKGGLQNQLSSESSARLKALQRIALLETKNQKLGHRQQLLQQELVNAEAQIDLITNLLFREHGL